MERLIKDYPTEEFSVIFGQEQLGDFYFDKKDYKQAEHFLRIVTNYYQDKQSRSGTSALADLKLSETILRSNQTDKFEEAYQLVVNYPISELTFNDSKFYYAAVGRLLQLNRKINKAQRLTCTVMLTRFQRYVRCAQARISDFPTFRHCALYPLLPPATKLGDHSHA